MGHECEGEVAFAETSGRWRKGNPPPSFLPRGSAVTQSHRDAPAWGLAWTITPQLVQKIRNLLIDYFTSYTSERFPSVYQLVWGISLLSDFFWRGLTQLLRLFDLFSIRFSLALKTIVKFV